MEDRAITENDRIFMEALGRLDPDLAMIRSYLTYTGVNAKVIPAILDQLKMLNESGGNGEVVIEVEDGHVTGCKALAQRSFYRSIDLDLVEKTIE